MKWGQRNFSKNVNNKRPFSTCFRLLNTCSPKGILNPLSWLWLAGLYVIEALFHMLPPDAHWPADLLFPGTGLQHGCVHCAHRQAPKEPLQTGLLDTEPGFTEDSPTVVSTVTRTRISLWWNILYVPVPGWTHSTKLYPNIKICFHRILERLVGTMNYFGCISVSEIYLETFHVWVTKTLLRPVHGAMICPKRRTLCSIIVSKQNFHFNNFEI